jgi:hypothetical protein
MNFYNEDKVTPDRRPKGPLHTPGVMGEVIRRIQEIEDPSDEIRDLKQDLRYLKRRVANYFFGKVDYLYIPEEELSGWKFEPDELELLKGFKEELAVLLAKAGKVGLLPSD